MNWMVWRTANELTCAIVLCVVMYHGWRVQRAQGLPKPTWYLQFFAFMFATILNLLYGGRHLLDLFRR